jgi:hypothetical protein
MSKSETPNQKRKGANKMKTYYITYNRNNEIEEVFTDAIAARAYATACGFRVEVIEAPAAGI